MPYPLPLTRTEAYLAYKAGVIQQSELKSSLSVPRIGIDAWLAYWTGLKNDYPKNPDGTPKMLQEEEKYIAYLCGVTDKYPEKCLRRVGAYLRYIISARWGRPDHPLNREELYLSLIKTQFIPSGDPSSDIVIDGTAKAEFVDVKMYGDTFQQRYEGKNLININFTDSTSDGVTKTLNSDGSITLNGHTTRGHNFKIAPAVDFEIGQTYTIHIEVLSGSFVPYNSNKDWAVTFVYTKEGSSSLQANVTENGDTASYTPTSSMVSQSVRLWFGHNSSTTSDMAIFDNFTFRVQIEKGSNATSYEPYTGGQASPNPDYPQPIQTVTGLQTVKVTGKNLFDGAVTHEFIMPGGIVSDNDDWNLSGYIKVSPNTAYTISFKQSSEPLHTVMISEFNANNGFIIRNRYEGSSSYTFTTSATTEFIRLNYLNISNDTDFQIELGSTATSYEPYTSTDYHFDLGAIELCKLGDYQDYIWKDQDQWKVHKETGAYTFNGEEPNWFKSGNTTDTILVAAISSGFKNILDMKTSERPLIKSDYFIWRNPLNQIIGSIDVYNGGNSMGMSFDIQKIPNLASAKAWVAANRPTILVVLATPTDTVITNQALIDQLEALVKGGSEDGTTYIKVSATEPNLPAKLYVEAPKYIE